jgi:hypothetical protein
MKKVSKFFIAILLLCILLAVSSTLYAQGPTAPPEDPSIPSGSGPSNNGPVGGGAPVGTGIIILASLAAIYGATNLLQLRRKKEENLPEQTFD